MGSGGDSTILPGGGSLDVAVGWRVVGLGGGALLVLLFRRVFSFAFGCRYGFLPELVGEVARREARGLAVDERRAVLAGAGLGLGLRCAGSLVFGFGQAIYDLELWCEDVAIQRATPRGALQAEMCVIAFSLLSFAYFFSFSSFVQARGGMLGSDGLP